MDYYVYILLDDRFPGNYDNKYREVNYKPFYVGKGYYKTKNKIKRHLIHYVDNGKSCDDGVNPHKCRTIRILKENNFEPNYIIVYEDDDEKKVLDVERELISFYGKKLNGGILTNITDGGVGGNLFQFVDGLQDRLKKISSEMWSGEKNPNFGKPIEETYSHLFKKNNGFHWNTGKTMGDKLKNKLKVLRNERLTIVEMLDVNTGEILDKLTTLDAINKYDLSRGCLYKCLKYGGTHKGYHWKYEGKELVLSKTLMDNYVRPKRVNVKRRKIYFKYNITDDIEYEYSDVHEASKYHNICEEVIRRKCLKNLKNVNIFRYEGFDYNIELTGDGKIPIIRIDNDGNEVIYNSITEAAKDLGDGNPSTIVAVCKGKRKTHRGYRFEYLKKM
jgi:hypothetical protein